jgi:hypothetical protein
MDLLGAPPRWDYRHLCNATCFVGPRFFLHDQEKPGPQDHALLCFLAFHLRFAKMTFSTFGITLPKNIVDKWQIVDAEGQSPTSDSDILSQPSFSPD